ncbi:hypothetical protein GFK91_15080 [Roseibium aggregatum]|uniref:hypothetical protein n=1 Tax=Roseibium aggregatum TaxID=187304 RepID=UPI001E532824|nr:hypothetical protein [Roseibium aggregatum]UES56821.1 hypothetical protein GFK91_15080 [Roseibium aggregatum]
MSKGSYLGGGTVVTVKGRKTHWGGELEPGDAQEAFAKQKEKERRKREAKRRNAHVDEAKRIADALSEMEKKFEQKLLLGAAVATTFGNGSFKLPEKQKQWLEARGGFQSYLDQSHQRRLKFDKQAEHWRKRLFQYLNSCAKAKAAGKSVKKFPKPPSEAAKVIREAGGIRAWLNLDPRRAAYVNRIAQQMIEG